MAFSLMRIGSRLQSANIGLLKNGLPIVNTPKDQVPIIISLQNLKSSKRIHISCHLNVMGFTDPSNQRPFFTYVNRTIGQREKIDLDSDSNSDSDSDSDTKKRGESEFWRRKMRTFHGILDINKDGVISYDDYKLLVDKFVNLGHLSVRHADEFRTLIQNMWEERWGSIDPYNLVTTEQYLEDMHHVMNDKSLRKKVHHFLPYLFKAVDKNKDGMITIDEYKLFFQCLNLSNEAASMSFYIIDENNDGHLSMKEFVKLGRDFFLSEDSRKPSKMFWGPLLD